MRHTLILASLLLALAAPAGAQVSIGIGLPGLSIGINVPTYPDLVPVPGYPVYYDPRASSNYFFYDGQYWVYREDTWYASGWYNGPWQRVRPEYVPLYVLRVPVRYYRQPPQYFSGWRADAPPRWGEHWGREWEQRRVGWDRWDRRSVPAAAPLPVYQRRYAGERYPRAIEQQQAIRTQNYRYQARENIPQQGYQRPDNRDGSRDERRAQPADTPRAQPVPPQAQRPVQPAPPPSQAQRPIPDRQERAERPERQERQERQERGEGGRDARNDNGRDNRADQRGRGRE